MGFFGNDQTAEIQILKENIETMKETLRLSKKKRLEQAAMLADERKKTEGLNTKITEAQLQLEKMTRDLALAKARQKDSRDRANRFKKAAELLRTS